MASTRQRSRARPSTLLTVYYTSHQPHLHLTRRTSPTWPSQRRHPHHRPRVHQGLHRYGPMNMLTIARTRTQERDALRARRRLRMGTLTLPRAGHRDAEAGELVPDHRRNLEDIRRIGWRCKKRQMTLPQMRGLRDTDEWARQMRRGRSLLDRRAMTPAIRDAESTTILPTALVQGEIRPGRSGIATARLPLPGGTIHRHGTAPVQINGPGLTIQGGPGLGEITVGHLDGMIPPVAVTMIGAAILGGSRHPVPAQEGPRGARCLSRTLKENRP